MKSGFKLEKVIFKIREGDKSGSLNECAIGGKWVDKTTDDFFKGKEWCYLVCQVLLHPHVHPNNCQDLKTTLIGLKN